MPDTIASAEARLRQALRARGEAKRAEWEKAYQKSRWSIGGSAAGHGRGDQGDARHAGASAGACPATVAGAGVGLEDRRRADPGAEVDRARRRVWRFVTERLIDLDGWAVADNLASVGSRCLIADPGRLDAVEAWIENRPLRESLA